MFTTKLGGLSMGGEINYLTASYYDKIPVGVQMINDNFEKMIRAEYDDKTAEDFKAKAGSSQINYSEAWALFDSIVCQNPASPSHGRTTSKSNDGELCFPQ